MKSIALASRCLRKSSFSPISWRSSTRPHLAHRRLEGANLEQHHSLRGGLHLINGVVHRRDQVLDVAPIERRDKRAPHRGGRVARETAGTFPTLWRSADTLAW